MKVSIYMIRYTCSLTGDKLWFPESLDKKVAKALCRFFARSGRKPVLFRVVVSPKQLLSIGGKVA